MGDAGRLKVIHRQSKPFSRKMELYRKYSSNMTKTEANADLKPQLRASGSRNRKSDPMQSSRPS
jgi:hypothetical protein